MTRTLACMLGLLVALLTACTSTSEGSRLAWEHIPHADGDECDARDQCVTVTCGGDSSCAIYFCEDAGRLIARGSGTIAPPAAPGSGPRRNWGYIQKYPGGDGPIFEFDWYNTPQREHRPPLLPSGPGWVRHHLFPQADNLAKWFARSPRGINVHDFTLIIEQATHQRIHSGPRGGAWNQEWTQFARQFPGATQQQVWAHLGKLIQKYDLMGPIVPYYYLR